MFKKLASETYRNNITNKDKALKLFVKSNTFA